MAFFCAAAADGVFSPFSCANQFQDIGNIDLVSVD